MLTMPCLIAVSLVACGGSSHHSSNGGNHDEGTTGTTADWVVSEGKSNTNMVQVLPEMKDTCIIENGTIAVSGDVWDAYGAWIWDPNNDDKNLWDGASWPGEEFTANVVNGCSAVVRNILPPELVVDAAQKYKSIDGYNIIINNMNNGGQTADLKGLSNTNNCVTLLKVDEKTVVGELGPARECGVNVEGQTVSDADVKTDVYAYNGSTKLTEEKTVEINEISGKEGSDSTEVTLLIKGANVDQNSKGFYWFNGDNSNKAEFTNGDIIKIGSGLKVADGEKANGNLHLQFVTKDADGNDVTVEKVYKFTKSFSEKNQEARMTKQTNTLGATYSADKTVFRIWSPSSTDVKVTVEGTEYVMNEVNLEGYSKVYEASVDGDLAGKAYQFTIGGKKVRDPYGRMAANGSDTANIVMDMSQTEPEGGWVDAPALKNREDSIVYEVHVRDFTIDETSGVDQDKKGRYLGMVQPGTTYHNLKTGIDHLKELGVTHVQLQPIYDYATCSGVDSQDNTCYNWGYDPWNYNIPEDRYSSVFGTDKYNEKIKEVKTMINEFHKNGIRVIMDVVYNHTFDKTVFQDISEKYYMGDNDLSGCGNAVNADNNMVWMMIRDSMDYWVSEFHIDGFRLDLAGVFGIKDFSDWGVYLNKQHPGANLLIYGEPWTGGGDPSAVTDPVRTGRMFMQDKDAHVGAFNNRIRNCLKSSSDTGKSDDETSRLGFIFNKLNTDWDSNGTDENGKALEGNKECVFMSVKAGVRTADAPSEVKDEWSAQGFSDPEQAISYITAHDNLALRDKIEDASLDKGATKLYSPDEVKTIQAYANSIIMISQGISFIHGGEEFGRTKAAAGTEGESPMWNTYKTTSGANDFKWNLKSEWNDVFNTYKAYINMRKEHPAFRMTTASAINSNVTLDESSTDETVIININGKAVNDTWGTIKVVMNSQDKDVTVAGVDEMTKVADGKTVGDVENNSTAAARSVSIWVVESTGPSKAHEQLYYIGATTNNWSDHEAMTYDSESGKWTLPVTLSFGNEEWLIKTETKSWADDITFSPCTADAQALCAKSNGGGNSNAKFSSTSGEHLLVIDDATMKWTLED
ncbi:MAG: hypothetical protein K5752_01540 [Succinivibrionaceae bacterium]|nr:hypothetical protein [Succinivibrionaceae bacterium]